MSQTRVRESQSTFDPTLEQAGDSFGIIQAISDDKSISIQSPSSDNDDDGSCYYKGRGDGSISAIMEQHESEQESYFQAVCQLSPPKTT